jgi:two-component system phosphate regulon sensor histidine kinase PhoR
MIEVSDNGHGIAPEHLTRIFERFYRVDPNRSRAKGGSGLGLSIVKRIIETHGYTIQADSQLNKGTRFRFGLKKG